MIEGSLQNIGYGLAGLVYLLLSLLLLTSFRGRLRGGLLTAASLVTAAWAFAMVLTATAPGLTSLQVFLAEILHDAAWLIFLSALLSGAVGAGRYWIVRFGGILLAAGILVIGIGQEFYLNYDVTAAGSGSTLILGSLLTALYALVVIEQIYRNARESQRKGLKYLCLGVGSIFAYDLFLYSNAILSGQINELFWGVRGYVVAMCAPLIAVAAQRSPYWSVGIFVSRQVVFYTATLFGAGVYLTIVGFAGYYLRVVGGDWGPAAQVLLFAAAVLALFVFLFSDTSRAKLRVFISKHFYENKYDYREEWLRLIATLTSQEEALPLKKRAIKALAQILDAPFGVLWSRTVDSENYRCVTGWNVQSPDAEIAATDPFIEFMTDTGWVIDLSEFAADPSHYQDIAISSEFLHMSEAAFVVPLLNNATLLGFVVLSESSSPAELNFEDRDLLKTAGQQIASYLAQEMAIEQLAEGRQFEAFNRLTAYLMHDLKNVIAQQSLVVQNAQKHRDNPAFIDDAVETIRGSVTRMRRVLEHLQQSSSDRPQENVEIGKLIKQTIAQCGDRKPLPRATIGEERVWVRADRDRLSMALSHAIRNTQDATTPDGEVTVELEANGASCTVCVTDDGSGMDEAFIRERLFKPFDSTKGTQGMGIGAYQIRETVRAMGGEVRIESEPDHGTKVTLEFHQAGGEKV